MGWQKASFLMLEVTNVIKKKGHYTTTCSDMVIYNNFLVQGCFHMLPIWAKSNLFMPPTPWISQQLTAPSVAIPALFLADCPRSVCVSLGKMAFVPKRLIFYALLAFEYLCLAVSAEKVSQVIFVLMKKSSNWQRARERLWNPSK